MINTSPSKPRAYSIPPRYEPNVSSGAMTPGPVPSISRRYPDTPPQTRATPDMGLGIENRLSARKQRQRLAFDPARCPSDLGPTPPASGSSTPYNASTARRRSSRGTGKKGLEAPTLTSIREPRLSELTTWILTELETSVAGVCRPALELDSPVLQVIRLSPRERQVPRTASRGPLGLHSNLNGPLSSHPPSAPATQQCPPEKLIVALRAVFPHADNQLLLRRVLATHLALRFVSEIHVLFSTSLTTVPSRHSSKHVPFKARAILGLPPMTSRTPQPSCWWRPENTWSERVEVLKSSLEGELEILISGAMASRSTVNKLISAVGEVADRIQ